MASPFRNCAFPMEFQVVINIEEGDGDEDDDDEITKILMKFRDRISNLPEELRILILQYWVLRSEKTTGNNEPECVNPQQPPLAVAPLNSMPYIGPPTLPSDVGETLSKRETETAEKVGPAMVFLPSHSTREEWNNIVFATRSGIALTGSAALGKVGPIIGLIDIGESEDSYLFRVSLPGVARDEKDFGCDIDPDGKISIKGVTTTGERIVCKNSQVFKMQTQNLCPPGHFSITFQLPGPVNNQYFSGNFGTDGILEGIVKKR